MPFDSHWHALTKASVIMVPMLKHIKESGITPVYTPSLSFGDAINQKRINFKASDIPKEKESNFPLFAWSRTPVVVSDEALNFRRLQVGGTYSLNTGTPFPLNTAWATFSINWLILFNNFSDFEEFEIVYTTEKLFSDFREFKVILPPLHMFSNLSEEERSITIGSEWEMFSNSETNKLNDYVQFSLSGIAKVTFLALSITDIDQEMIKQIHLGFYSDLEFKYPRDRYELVQTKDGKLDFVLIESESEIKN